jgi:hypothetical protein
MKSPQNILRHSNKRENGWFRSGRACLTVLAGSIEGQESVEARATFHSLQATIEALDRAIDDERKIEDERRQLEGANNKEVRKRRIEHTSGLDSDDSGRPLGARAASLGSGPWVRGPLTRVQDITGLAGSPFA